ncbi:MAG: purine-nucleoside phosphorylase [Spirochaetes bacterium GWD1_61_31]|nr:MAG: purine-nucleoside phosphorylase [Spirochaetes bacterium GWB1_60_80]OHD32132.1 MAG: purine-nucleoside phosphorylase [Spirochaetes bacterium GWC1_61_12]OHD37133.1 MAG: purine-nucleoside phosphorylase [Spirochaetes bacterium GWD1_61_31]OHD42651.1 MAG: purine-nucleoside phosphorylase [Spirochaetes bacterium GWE1_60_18]OHD58532.1 MAG: purine-nucleoside phosphorylase [Spirochaetes bacterium GWF1_60_12]HAP43964.1 purine-nucleoside phosphorylase [Spirochaetaceae bacterium]
MSIHIEAAPGAIAEAILLPGDPLRAKFIAENYLEKPEQFNRVRNMFGYTGTYKGKRVSVMGTGMGMPSHSIYVHELLQDYKVKKLIRVGTCGSLQADVKIRDVILATAASTNSNVNRIRFSGMDYAPAADFGLLETAWRLSQEKNLPARAGTIISSDMFYTEDPDEWKLWAKFGVLGVEMETAELYTIAAKFRAQALAILTVSDSLVTHEATKADEREKTFRAMAELGLETIIAD